ncbi:MAG: uncharacterized protein PWP04_1212 [Candidatus Atribacteria bacterium]|nr:uncharacterized protein [Candidatus Atribacteria bacterium]
MMDKLLWITTILALAFLIISPAVGEEKSKFSQEEFFELSKNFFQYLKAEKYHLAGELFSSEVQEALPEEALQKMWEGLNSDLGLLKEVRVYRADTEGGYRTIYSLCEFEKAELTAKLLFSEEGKIVGFQILPSSQVEYSPPDYVEEDKIIEREIVLGIPGWELPGTLTLPQGESSFPALVLVHGSGPNDRDESIFANKPFRDLSWGLASRGIASLRYDKRTYVHGTKIKDLSRFTVEEEVIEDALAALDFLRGQKEINPQEVFVLGHSLGGQLVPEIARRDGRVAGVIILAGPTRPLSELIVEQTEYIFSLDGQIDEKEKEQLEEIKKGRNLLKNYELKEDEIVPGLGSYANYWYNLEKRNPIVEASKLSCPLLILQGARDYQVTLLDFNNWKEGLSSRDNVRFKLYPQLNHLFIAGEGKSTPEEYQSPGHVDKQVIEDITQWIKKVSQSS